MGCDRRTFVGGLAASALMLRDVRAHAAVQDVPRVPGDFEPRIVEPPGPAQGEVAERIRALRAELEPKKIEVDAVLRDSRNTPLRPYTEFRELIRDHARAARVPLVPDGEPGEALLVRATVKDAAGQPAANALVYAYQTSAKGWYSDRAPHIGGNSGDTKHARLFGYARTGANGAFELVTIRPAGYPRSDLPCHIHLGLTAADGAELWTEICFEDDPRLTPAARAEALRAGFVLVRPEKDGERGWVCAPEFRLPARRAG